MTMQSSWWMCLTWKPANGLDMQCQEENKSMQWASIYIVNMCMNQPDGHDMKCKHVSQPNWPEIFSIMHASSPAGLTNHVKITMQLIIRNDIGFLWIFDIWILLCFSFWSLPPPRSPFSLRFNFALEFIFFHACCMLLFVQVIAWKMMHFLKKNLAAFTMFHGNWQPSLETPLLFLLALRAWGFSMLAVSLELSAPPSHREIYARSLLTTKATSSIQWVTQHLWKKGHGTKLARLSAGNLWAIKAATFQKVMKPYFHK